MSSNSKIFFNLRYRYTQYTKKNLTKKQEKNKINTKNAFDYYDRDEACDKTISTKNAFDYYDFRLGSCGGFDSTKNITVEESQALCDKYKPQVIYQSVLSFDKEFAIEQGIMDKMKMQKLVQKSMNSILKRLELEPDNVIWSAYYHTNTDNPHCHITFYEKEQTRQKEVFPRKQIERVRSEIVSELELNMNMYIKKDDTLKELLNSISGLTDSMKDSLMESSNSTNKISIPKELLKKIEKLENDLPKQGSLKYNSKNIRTYHEQIRDILSDLYELDEIKPFYQMYKKTLDELKDIQKELYGTGLNKYTNENGEIVSGNGKAIKDIDEYYRKQMYSLETKVANMLLQTIKNAREDVIDFEKTKSYNIGSKETNDEQVEPQEGAKGKQKSSSKVFKKKNLARRTGIVCGGGLQELAKEISQIQYAINSDKQKIAMALRMAQNEIYEKNQGQGVY